VLYAGLAYLFLAHLHQEVPVFLIVAALFGSLLVSYVRARAQSLGYTCDVGWFARPERVVITALGLMLGLMVPVLWILAVATNLTALQRIHAVYRQYRKAQDQAAPAAPAEGIPEPAPDPRRRRGAAPSSP
jgi:CDP-diacylglycerol--glycerol-3-phosphate 3-phosphatidyltransferase